MTYIHTASRRARSERTLSVSDIHAGFHCETALSAVLKVIIPDYRPEHVILNGDVFDAYHWSRYEKNPSIPFDPLREIELAKDIVTRICNAARKANPDVKFYWLDGNHEDRVRRVLWGLDAPTRAMLRADNIPQLLELSEHGFVKYVEYAGPDVLNHFGTVVTHGHRVSKHSAYTAKMHLDEFCASGISGHTHRLGEHYKTTHTRRLKWVEQGCLCRLNPKYMNSKPNWQHGCAVGEIPSQPGLDRMRWRPVEIINGEPML